MIQTKRLKDLGKPAMSRLSLVTLIAALPELAFCAGSANGSIPWSLISAQAINVGVVCLIVGFLMVRQSKSYFSNRASQFRQMVDQAKQERIQAEIKLKEFEDRLNDLRATFDQTLETASKDANELKRAVQSEAQQLSLRIRLEASQTAKYEIERAKRVLMTELLSKSVSKARNEMLVQEPDQKRLKSEFVQKIQVVHS